NIEALEHFKKGSFHGEVLQYYRNGQLKRKEVYKFGEMKSGQCYTAAGADTAYFVDRVIPRFPGGDDKFMLYIFSHPLYKEFQKTNKISGEVLIDVDFDEQGKVVNATYNRKVHPALDEVAMKLVIQIPNWEPAEDENGNPV